jgi:hypothetical protein
MRWILRLFLLVVLLIGLVLAFAYPWAVDNVDGYEIGSWRAFSGEGEFRTFEPSLAPSDSPVRVYAYATVAEPVPMVADVPVLELEVTGDGAPVLTAQLSFDRWEPEPGPEGGIAYRDYAGSIEPVSAERYVVAVRPLSLDPALVNAVDVTLIARSFERDPAIPPLGYVMTAVGFIGLVLSFRRRRQPKPPEPPRWGRG